MVTTRAREICSHCGGTLIIENEDSERYCLLCGRPYKDYRDYGRIGGQRTLAKHGREHFVALGRRGGRPRTNNHRQLPAPETENKIREGMAARPNNLRVLKELWRERREELLAVTSSSQEVINATNR